MGKMQRKNSQKAFLIRDNLKTTAYIVLSLPSTRAQGSNVFDLPVVDLEIGGNPRFQIDHGSWGWT